MKNVFAYVGAVLSSLIIIFTFMMSYKVSPGGELLKEFGWEFEPEPAESAELVIPEAFDSVWENYNSLQKESGLDLEPYRGKRASRHTYIITNYPDKSYNVRGNVIVVDGRGVAGDVCTVEADGFMLPLKKTK